MKPTCRGRRLAVSRIRHPRIQPRHAVPALRARAACGRHCWAVRGLIQTAGSTGAVVQAHDRADWLTEAATGFLVGGAHDVVGNQTLEGMLQQRADDLDDMITATGTTFLGLTIQCARCHDHKFDPITQKDYYGLQAILAGVNHAERAVPAPDSEARRRLARALEAELRGDRGAARFTEPLAQPGRDRPTRPMVNPMRNVDRFAPVPARMVRLTILATNNQTEPCLDEVEVYSAAGGRRLAAAKRRRGSPPGAGRRHHRNTECARSTRLLISTTDRPATAIAGSRACRARAASRSPGPKPSRSTASSGAAIARRRIATGWPPSITSRRPLSRAAGRSSPRRSTACSTALRATSRRPAL